MALGSREIRGLGALSEEVPIRKLNHSLCYQTGDLNDNDDVNESIYRWTIGSCRMLMGH